MPSGVWTLSWTGSYPPLRSSRRRSSASFWESSTSSTRKVLVAVAFLVRALGKFGLLRRSRAVPLVSAPEREVEGGSLAYLALRPDPAAVPVDDARHRRQPYARPLELVLPVQPLESPEQLVRVRLVEARPVVPHVVDGGERIGTGLPVCAELYARLRFPVGELPRVAEQVLERHLEQADIPPGFDVLPRRELDVPPRLRGPQVLDYLQRKAGQVDGFPAQGPASHPRKFQQVIYERGHVHAGRPYAAEVVQSLVVEHLFVVLLQDLGEPVYGPQGGPQIVGDRVGERLQLPVGPFELPVGVLQVLAGILGQHAAAHEHPGDAEEQDAYAYAAGEHEGRQVALGTILESWQRGEVQAPLAPSHPEAALLGEERIVPLLSGALHPVFVVEEGARRNVGTVVNLEVYGRVEAAPEHVVEQPVPPEISDDEPFEGAPSCGDTPNRLPLGVDWKVHGEPGAEDEVGAQVRGWLREHIDHPGSLRRACVARLVHGNPVGLLSVGILVYHAQVGLVRRGDQREGKVSRTLPAGIQVGPHLGHPLSPGLPDESRPLVGPYISGEAERLQALQPALGLYALDVALPLSALDRLAGQEQAAGAEQRVEVSVRPPVYGRLSSLEGLIETDLILRLDRMAHVVPGKPSEKERDQEHPVSRRSEAQVAQEPA